VAASNAEGRTHIHARPGCSGCRGHVPLSYDGVFGPVLALVDRRSFGMLIEIGVGPVALASGVRSGWVPGRLAWIVC
jgi:hypothetical protein